MGTQLLFCESCSSLERIENRSSTCPLCDHPIDKRDRLKSGSALGLVGITCTGKSTYLATLHDQLMHSAPEWRVEVSDSAFHRLMSGYQALRQGQVFGATDKFFHPFLMKVLWNNRQLDLVMWDSAGENYSNFALRDDVDSYSNLDLLLSECKCIMVAILCERMQDTISGTDRYEEDELLGKLFRRILGDKNHLRRAIALLIGVDRYGNTPNSADHLAVEDFRRTYRIFPGILNNAGVTVTAVPVSNIGFGNVITEGRLINPPKPYNVLEPLRLAFPTYMPWWSRKMVSIGKGAVPVSWSSVDDGEHVTADSSVIRVDEAIPQGTVFISYRREGGAETARLIRNSLQARGWKVFLDVEDLGSSLFDQRLLLEILNSDNFIVVLSPNSLERCVDPKDWFRREIAWALEFSHANIVPILKDGFTFPSEEALPKEICALSRYNSVPYSHQYFEATLDRIISFLVKKTEH